jgi:Lon-like protease
VAFFDPSAAPQPAPPRRSRAAVAGSWALAVALVVLLLVTFLPTSYVIQQPGPVYDTLGTVSDSAGGEVPLISVADAPTYPTTGSLDLLTVQVAGNPERRPSWFEIAVAWFDPARAVLPIERIFPAGQTTEQRQEESAALMVDSQEEAKAAALTELGYDVPSRIRVYSVVAGSAAEGAVEEGDILLSVDGTAVTDAAQVRDAVAAGEGAPVSLRVERDGEERELSITPRAQEQDGGTVWLLGVQLIADFDFPIDVTIQLDDVGGPSAGMMFALGIIDVLTTDDLTGGRRIAGTGTIDAEGRVGPIGGIRQKLFGARDAEAEYFLAPEANCGEVVGHVPDGIRVFSVAELDDSLDVLAAIRDGGDLDALPTCSSAAS